jgi:uncharacterized protein
MMSVDFIGRGWAFPLGVQPNGSVATAQGVAKLEQAMRIILTTYLGERPMRPGFGSRLRDFLFDGVSPASVAAIGEEVERAIGSCESRVDVEAVDVRPIEGAYGGFEIDIQYVVRDTLGIYNLVVPFYSIPGEEG